MSRTKVSVRNLNAWFAEKQALKNINIDMPDKNITAIIGPSGCGKSTFVRCINRMHETVYGAKMTGRILIDGEDINSPDSDPVLIRRKAGMVFQKPTPFPTMTIYDNVASGLKLNGMRNREKLDEAVEASLKHAAL